MAKIRDLQVVRGKVLCELKDYLLAHELDIALDINDYDDLRNLFHLIFERWPSAKG